MELSAKNNWTHTFSNLPLKAKGKEIQYQVKEVGTVKGYTSTVDDSNKGNVVITNSRTPEVTEVAVKKIWDDADNKDDLRPEKITVRLLADGQEVAVKKSQLLIIGRQALRIYPYTRKVRRLPTRLQRIQ